MENIRENEKSIKNLAKIIQEHEIDNRRLKIEKEELIEKYSKFQK